MTIADGELAAYNAAENLRPVSLGNLLASHRGEFA